MFISIDPYKKLIKNMECLMANISDIGRMKQWRRREEVIRLGGRVHHKNNRTVDAFQNDGYLFVLTPTLKLTVGILTKGQKMFNQMLSLAKATNKLYPVNSLVSGKLPTQA